MNFDRNLLLPVAKNFTIGVMKGVPLGLARGVVLGTCFNFASFVASGYSVSDAAVLSATAMCTLVQNNLPIITASIGGYVLAKVCEENVNQGREENNSILLLSAVSGYGWAVAYQKATQENQVGALV